MANHDFIDIDNVSKRFGSVTAIDGVNLQIAKGEFFGLLGPSGCGKTTLLRLLGGFETLREGEIRIDGESMSAVPPDKRSVNMVFQSYAIFPHLNVFQNIAFGLKTEKLSSKEVARRVNEALAMIRLEGYDVRRAHELSGGQRQRVALARALIREPKVLLLDEPLGALDKKLREQMQFELRDLQRKLGITFVFVTHDQEEALTMSDRIAVMSDGKILELGTPSELYVRPQTRFVADFLGAMNFIKGTIRGRDGTNLVIETKRFGTIHAASTGRDFADGESVTVGLRPENIRMHSRQPEDQDIWIEGSIRNAAFLGDRTHFQVSAGDDDEPLLVGLQNLEDGATGRLQPDSRLYLSWSPSAVLVLRDDDR